MIVALLSLLRERFAPASPQTPQTGRREPSSRPEQSSSLCGGCQIAPWRDALLSHAADVRQVFAHRSRDSNRFWQRALLGFLVFLPEFCLPERPETYQVEYEQRAESHSWHHELVSYINHKRRVFILSTVTEYLLKVYVNDFWTTERVLSIGLTLSGLEKEFSSLRSFEVNTVT